MKRNPSEIVTAYIQGLDPQHAETIEFLRQLLLQTDSAIGEQIKWNSPSFYYTGEMKAFDAKEYKRDIVVINLHRGTILLVFPTGARIDDQGGVLEGNYPDGRKIVTINSLEDAKSKKNALQKAVLGWLATIEK